MSTTKDSGACPQQKLWTFRCPPKCLSILFEVIVQGLVFVNPFLFFESSVQGLIYRKISHIFLSSLVPFLTQDTQDFQLCEQIFAEHESFHCTCSLGAQLYQIDEPIFVHYFFPKMQNNEMNSEIPSQKNMIKKWPAEHSRKLYPNPRFLRTAKAYFIYLISPKIWFL